MIALFVGYKRELHACVEKALVEVSAYVDLLPRRKVEAIKYYQRCQRECWVWLRDIEMEIFEGEVFGEKLVEGG